METKPNTENKSGSKVDKFSCYQCGSEKSKVVATKSDIRFKCYGHDKSVLKCKSCGLTQLYPQWTEKELDDLYNSYNQKGDFKGYLHKNEYRNYLEEYMDKSQRILEIGCGRGYEVERLRQMGYNVVGIDKDPSVCDEIIIKNRDYRDYEPFRKFDFIYAIHVFEHILDPEEFVAWVLTNLRPGGEFLLEFPNVDDPLLTIYRNKAFKKFYWYPYHVFFYNAKSTANLFSKFPNVKIKTKLSQRYNLINHLRWLLFNKPGNVNFKIPVIDHIYHFVLNRIFRKSDTIIVHGIKDKHTA